jgi:methylmalonyl-CoA/ethylmalonyl-CoA epimerase
MLDTGAAGPDNRPGRRNEGMRVDLSRVGQVALSVADADRAEAFYEGVLGLRKLYRFGDLVFFDCAGLRLMIAKAEDPADVARASTLYLRCADMALAVAELKQRGVEFVGEPHLIAPMEDHDLWMAFFRDPDDHLLALMQEAPKGYRPPVQEAEITKA